jgi:hypothetical protein
MWTKVFAVFFLLPMTPLAYALAGRYHDERLVRWA